MGSDVKERTIRSPFEGIDLNDARAVASVHEKAIELGEPLSAELRTFCRENDLRAFPPQPVTRNWNLHKIGCL